MLINTILNEPCPFCRSIGNYGNVSVSHNTLRRGCNSCKQWDIYNLPDLNKKVIYLDQFFLSHAFRMQEKPFVDAVERIKDLAAKQLVVCPFSSVHTKETHLWRHEDQQNLYEFIKRTARGHKFSQDYEIKEAQIQRNFELFKNGEELEISLDVNDACNSEINCWDDYMWIDMRPHLADLDELREGKAAAVSALVDLFPQWANLQTTFNEDIRHEALGYGRSLVKQYFDMVMAVGQGDIMAHLNAPIDSTYVETLLYYDSKDTEIDFRIKRISDFFCSDYFIEVPFVKVSCGIFAVLRKMVKNGAYTNPEKAKKKLSGLYYDAECISVFGPYCDAMFIDKAMESWCSEPEARLLDPHNTKLFSANSWDRFNEYLDEIEQSASADIKQSLLLAFGINA